MIQKVLIATDGSEHAIKAIAFSSDIAAKYDAEVVLVHVLLHSELSEGLRDFAAAEHIGGGGSQKLSRVISEMSPGPFPASLIVTSDEATTADQVLRAAAETLLEQAKHVAREHGVSEVATRIEDGDPVARILEVAKAEAADLIVTGARGLSDLKGLLVGSISHKLSHLSPVTCITVR